MTLDRRAHCRRIRSVCFVHSPVSRVTATPPRAPQTEFVKQLKVCALLPTTSYFPQTLAVTLLLVLWGWQVFVITQSSVIRQHLSLSVWLLSTAPSSFSCGVANGSISFFSQTWQYSMACTYIYIPYILYHMSYILRMHVCIFIRVTCVWGALSGTWEEREVMVN